MAGPKGFIYSYKYEIDGVEGSANREVAVGKRVKLKEVVYNSGDARGNIYCWIKTNGSDCGDFKYSDINVGYANRWSWYCTFYMTEGEVKCEFNTGHWDWGSESWVADGKRIITLKGVKVPCSDWTTKSSCEAAGCFWYNNACHRFRPTVCSDYTDALTCVAHNCYWWLDGTCHDTEEAPPEYCSQNVRVVTSDGAGVYPTIYWGDGSSSYGGETPYDETHRYEKGKTYTIRVTASGYTDASRTITTCVSQFTLTLTKEEVPCSDWTTKSSCEAAGCFWYNNACHRFRPTVCSDYTDALTCVAHNCYWWLDGTCHDTEEAPPLDVGSINVRSSPDGARIWVKPAGKTHFYDTGYSTHATISGLPVGVCSVKVKKEGYKDAIKTVTIYKNQTTIVSFTLTTGESPECTTNADCPVGYICIDGKCVEEVAPSAYAECGRAPTSSDSKTYITNWWKCAYGVGEKRGICHAEATWWHRMVINDAKTELGVTTIYFLSQNLEIDGDYIKIWMEGTYLGGFKWKCPVSAGKFIINVPKGIFGPIGKGVVMVYKVYKLPFIDAYVSLGLPAKDFWCENPPCTFELTDLEIGSKYAIFPSSSISVLPYVTSKCVYEFTDKVQTIDLPVYIDPLSTVLCAFFDLTPSECAVFLMEFQDPIYAANTLSVIQHHEDIMGNAREPETLDYIMLPIVMAGSLLPMLPVGQISKYTGRLLKLGKKSAASKLFLIRNHHKMHQLIAVGDETRILKFKGFFDLDNLDEALKVLDEGIVASEATEAAKALKRASLREWVGGIIAKWKLKKPKTPLEKVMDYIAEHGGNVFKTQADVVVKHIDDAKGDWTKIRKIWDDTVKTADDVVYVELHLAGKTDDFQVMHNLRRYSKDEYINALKAAKAGIPEFSNRFDEGLEFMLRHIGSDVTPEARKYAKALDGLSDAEIDDIVRNLRKVGTKSGNDCANNVEALRKLNKYQKTGGAVDGVKAIADDVKDCTTKKGQKAAHKVGKEGAETIPPTAADNAKDAAHSKFFSRRKLPKVVKYLTNWKVWTFYMSFCFFPFIAEETAQRIGFLSIPDMATIQTLIRLDQKEKALIELHRAIIELEGDPATGEGGIIKEFNDKINFWYDVASVPCFWMKPWYDRYFEVHNYDLTEKARNYKVVRDALKENLSLTPDDVGSIEVITNLAGARVHIDGFPTFVLTTKINAKAKAIIHNIKTEAGTIGTQHSVMVFDPSGANLMDSALVTVYKGKMTSVEFTLNPYTDVPEDALDSLLSYIDSLNEVGGQSGLENQRQPYGNVNPDTWFYGTCKFHCTSTPSGAWVWIDGEDKKKQTPCFIDDITAYLPHRVEFKHPNYPTKVFENQWAKTDKTIDIDYVFEEPCSEPSAHIKPSTYTPKVGVTVVFDPSGSDPGTGASYKTNGLEWDFGDGTKVAKTTEEKVSHSYSAKGVYHVNLKVTNDCGNSRDATPVVITVEVATGNIKCYCEPAEYCSRNADIFVDGNKVDVTKESGYTYIKDLTQGVHTVKYNLLDVMECSGSVTVTADKDVDFSCQLKSKLPASQTAKVTAIVDGDGIKTDKTGTHEIRIIGYDAFECRVYPSDCTLMGKYGYEKLKSLIPVGTSVTLKIDQWLPLGVYNRVIADVFVGTTDIAAEMLKSCLVRFPAKAYRDKYFWDPWDEYARIWCDPTKVIPPDEYKPKIVEIETATKTFKIKNNWLALWFLPEFVDSGGTVLGTASERKIEIGKTSSAISYFIGTYAIKLYARVDTKDDWTLVDTGYVAVAPPTKKTVTFKSVPSGASVKVVKKETARLVRVLKKVINI